MTNNTHTAGESSVLHAAPSIADLYGLYGRVSLRKSSITNLKSDLKQARNTCSAALATLLKYLENSYGKGATLSAEEFNATGMRTRDLYLQKKVADDDLKNLLDQIEEEETKKTQDELKIKLGESALKRAAVVSVSMLKEVEFIWQRKIKCRRIELVRGNDPGEVAAIREFCGSHSLEIQDAGEIQDAEQ